ncbi:MAG: TadE/TadG family type IV pilus assembly protein [Anaerolineae bacterium]
MGKMRMRQRKRGQSMLEFALILPFLVLLLVATVEAGFALRDYVMVQSVNREGVRWAVRTPPTHGREEALEHLGEEEIPEVFDRILVAASEGGLRAADVGIIITHIYLTPDGTPPDDPDDYRYQHSAPFDMTTQLDVPALWGSNAAKSGTVNATREAAGYEAWDNETVVVEVFYRHETVWGFGSDSPFSVGPFGEDWVMYAQSSMRMIGTGR